MLRFNDSDAFSSGDLVRTPSKQDNNSFNVHSTCLSSAKKSLPMNYDGTTNIGKSSSLIGTVGGLPNMDLVQAKIAHLEKERLDLTIQLHSREEKDRDRKFRLEQSENRLKSSEEERNKAVNENNDLKEQMVRLKYEYDLLQEENAKLNKEIQTTNRYEAMDVWKKMTAASRALKRCEEELSQANQDKQVLHKDLSQLECDCAQQKATITTQEEELHTLREKLMQLEEENNQISLQKDEIKRLTIALADTVAQLKEKTESAEEIIDTLSKERDELKEKLSLKEEMQLSMSTDCSSIIDIEEIARLKKLLYENELKRRKLHNQVQDLKGNIRVFVRCRPFLPGDGEDTMSSQLLWHEDKSTVSIVPVPGAKPSHTFAFDHCFQKDSSQQDIYKEVSDLVQSVLDGFRVCVFSYGQTGSGKTHTMTGSRHGDGRGIIPRAVEELLSQTDMMQSQGWAVAISVSIVEIYNEDIRDLLTTPNNVANTTNKCKIGKQGNRVVVSGLSSVELKTSKGSQEALKQFHAALSQSSETRSTACTGMNEQSSRSHLIVMIDVTATLESSGMSFCGGLRLCDLAGSERLDRSNTLHDAARLRETVNINKSLSCLADVFLALSNKSSHVPYRNSKLTMLLQDCLSGDGKSLMFVNVSPTAASTHETLCSLRFASQVSQVELGKAQKHIIITTTAPGASAATAPLPVSVSLPVPPAPAAAASSTVPPRSALKTPAMNLHSLEESHANAAHESRSVRFSQPPQPPLPEPVTGSAAASETDSSTASSAPATVNKPLGVYSFLSQPAASPMTSSATLLPPSVASSGAPVAVPGALSKPRNLGPSSRRNSVLGNPSVSLLGMSRSSRLSTAAATTTASSAGSNSENDSSHSNKREVHAIEGLSGGASKRVRSGDTAGFSISAVTAIGSSSSSSSSEQPAWNSSVLGPPSSNSTHRKSLWR